jgi:hypothetical protein
LARKLSRPESIRVKKSSSFPDNAWKTASRFVPQVAQNFRSIELSLPQVGQNIAESPPGTSASNTNVIAFEMHKSRIAHKCPITIRVSDGTVNARKSLFLLKRRGNLKRRIISQPWKYISIIAIPITDNSLPQEVEECLIFDDETNVFWSL